MSKIVIVILIYHRHKPIDSINLLDSLRRRNVFPVRWRKPIEFYSVQRSRILCRSWTNIFPPSTVLPSTSNNITNACTVVAVPLNVAWLYLMSWSLRQFVPPNYRQTLSDYTNTYPRKQCYSLSGRENVKSILNVFIDVSLMVSVTQVTLFWMSTRDINGL
jgi:hypothetical protein